MTTAGELEAAVRESATECRGIQARHRLLADQLEEEHAEARDRLDAHDRERAAAARAGDSGPLAEELQRRLDRGETTLAGIVGGEDQHPSADRARAEWSATLDGWLDDPGFPRLRDPDVTDPLVPPERAGR